MARKVYWHIGIGIIVLLLLAGVLAGANYLLHLNRYVVKVNGQGMPVDEFKVYMKIVKKEKEKLAGVTKHEDILKFWTEPVEGSDPVVFARQEALDSVINLMLISQKANENNLQSKPSDQALLREKLSAQGFTGELKNMGVSDKHINMIIKDLSLKFQLFNYLTQKVTLTKAEFQKIISDNPELVRQYNVRHILFLTVDANKKQLPKDKQEAALKLAKEVLKRAQKGEDFSELAKEYSQDPGSKDIGGKYSFYKGEAVPEFQDAVFKLKPGEISQIVKTAYGYHIIKLDSYVTPQGQELERIQKNIYDTYTEKKRNTFFDEQLNKWKQEAHIEKNEQLLNSISIYNL